MMEIILAILLICVSLFAFYALKLSWKYQDRANFYKELAEDLALTNGKLLIQVYRRHDRLIGLSESMAHKDNVH